MQRYEVTGRGHVTTAAGRQNFQLDQLAVPAADPQSAIKVAVLTALNGRAVPTDLDSLTWSKSPAYRLLEGDQPTLPINDITELDPKIIHTDGGTQARAGLTPSKVDEYQERMEAGDTFPPITVYYDGANYWLADGYHRLYAHRSAYRKPGYGEGYTRQIAAHIKQGTRREAILHACGANSEHGLQRTNEDKARAVTVLLEDKEWGTWSDREIARTCHVSHPFVAKLREKVTGNVTSDGPPTERTYTTKHGTTATMNTAAIGKSSPLPRIMQIEADTPAPAAPIARDRHWGLTNGMAFWRRVEALGIEKTGVIGRLQPGANYLTDLTISREETWQKLAELAAKDHSRRPTPPAGYLPLGEWKHSVCPICKEHGFVWNGSRWQDEEALELQRQVKELDDAWFANGRQGIRPDGGSPEFIALRDHWSRFATGECLKCNCRFWHDFVDPWQYYYAPPPEKATPSTPPSPPQPTYATVHELESHVRAWLEFPGLASLGHANSYDHLVDIKEKRPGMGLAWNHLKAKLIDDGVLFRVAELHQACNNLLDQYQQRQKQQQEQPEQPPADPLDTLAAALDGLDDDSRNTLLNYLRPSIDWTHQPPARAVLQALVDLLAASAPV